jgi:Pyruvate-formate lyase
MAIIMDYINELGGCVKINEMAKALFASERAKMRLDGWFLCREIAMKHDAETTSLSLSEKAAYILNRIADELPLSIDENAIFAGTQRDAFARSYALINPSFRVDTFGGYCDPTAVYGDIEPNAEFTADRIETVKEFDRNSIYVRELNAAYESAKPFTDEVEFFMEQVTGHVIADYRQILGRGIYALIDDIDNKVPENEEQRVEYAAMKSALGAALSLARRYRELAIKQAETAEIERKAQLTLIASALEHVPAYGACSLFEALQSFMMLWQTVCLEQAPNPFALSVGNADRIFEPYRQKSGESREEAAALLRHFLVFFNVGDRSWAISQNILISGIDNFGNDLTNTTSYALLDAYYDMNLPQPILSVKLHKNTPERLYRELGRFFFTPGCLTPSFFNDDMLFMVLSDAGVEVSDLPEYAVAGCQEPLIMGRDNGNTTNTWLNLGKILELTLTGGKSLLSGKRFIEDNGADTHERLIHLRDRFFENTAHCVHEMAHCGNACSRALSNLRVPFLSALMGGIDYGYDMRDTEHQGTRYNGSGCLIHGLTVVSDSFTAVDCLLRDRPQDAERLITALENNFENDDELRQYLLSCPKFGNNENVPDLETAATAEKIAAIVRREKNYLGNPFRPDFSTPSTHLLYGYWVGALPCGRKSRDMLNYGVDPFYGDTNAGLGFRTLSARKLPYIQMCGGYASHLGIDPGYFSGVSFEEKGLQFRDRVLYPLFNSRADGTAPFYLYLNVTTPEILRKVLANPKKYAPSGIYIMRIHGTFVNFLDLSPEIQQDIIKRLDLKSSYIS